jgi:hypothetical protein
MAKSWKRISITMRIIAALILVVVLYMGVDVLLEFYSDNVGFTPERAIETYFEAIFGGRADEAYRMTAPESLVDIYGRPVTEGEFREQVRRLTGGSATRFSRVRAHKVFERDGVRYYTVDVYSHVGGTEARSRVYVQLTRVDRTWRVWYPFAIIL